MELVELQIVSWCFIMYLHFLAHDVLCLDYSCLGEIHWFVYVSCFTLWGFFLDSSQAHVETRILGPLLIVLVDWAWFTTAQWGWLQTKLCASHIKLLKTKMWFLPGRTVVGSRAYCCGIPGHTRPIRTQNADSLNYMIFLHAYYVIEFCPFPLPL